MNYLMRCFLYYPTIVHLASISRQMFADLWTHFILACEKSDGTWTFASPLLCFFFGGGGGSGTLQAVHCHFLDTQKCPLFACEWSCIIQVLGHFYKRKKQTYATWIYEGFLCLCEWIEENKCSQAIGALFMGLFEGCRSQRNLIFMDLWHS